MLQAKAAGPLSPWSGSHRRSLDRPNKTDLQDTKGR